MIVGGRRASFLDMDSSDQPCPWRPADPCAPSIQTIGAMWNQAFQIPSCIQRHCSHVPPENRRSGKFQGQPRLIGRMISTFGDGWEARCLSIISALRPVQERYLERHEGSHMLLCGRLTGRLNRCVNLALKNTIGAEPDWHRNSSPLLAGFRVNNWDKVTVGQVTGYLSRETWRMQAFEFARLQDQS